MIDPVCKKEQVRNVRTGWKGGQSPRSSVAHLCQTLARERPQET